MVALAAEEVDAGGGGGGGNMSEIAVLASPARAIAASGLRFRTRSSHKSISYQEERITFEGKCIYNKQALQHDDEENNRCARDHTWAPGAAGTQELCREGRASLVCAWWSSTDS